MPRGVPIPELRERLFAATERVLERDGPQGLNSRAITDEAGVAKGVLHNHFADLDQFLAEFVLTRFGDATETLERLPLQAGHGTVAENLTDAIVTLFGSHAPALIATVRSRPSLMRRISEAASSRRAILPNLEMLFASYLEAEKQQARIAEDADTAMVAFALVGSAHHLVLTRRSDAADLEDTVRRLVNALLQGAAARVE